LSGSQNFFSQDGQSKSDQEANIKQIIDYIETQHNLWNEILTPSASSSATGSLVNAVAGKLIADVFDLSDIGVDEAERTATLLSKVEKLDDLFVQQPNNGNGVGIPMTSQFADKWMKMKFLSEVLQSNLKEIKYLWFESDLSLYFTSDEVVELMNLSFQMNANVRAAIREIKENPAPRGEMAFD
jgi:centromere/kinetochore protein ZW10